MIIAYAALLSRPCCAGEAGNTGFEIKAFEVTSNTLIPDDKLRSAVASFTGVGKTATDVENARDVLEKLYHDAGYPTVIVNIPEQTLQDGIVKLQVIESRVGRIRVTGNRYFTIEKLLKDLPSLAPGTIIYLPDVQKEIGRLNASQDIKVDPIMSPGKEVGTIDVELRVEDHLPLHGYLELNNRASPNTSPLRLNALVHYDNLWQQEHSLSLQCQVAPVNPKDAKALAVSYAIPAPWQKEDQVALYGVWSDSNTAFGEGFRVIGKGQIYGIRGVTTLPPYKLYAHAVTLGVDYKHFDQGGFTGASGPISYLPFMVSYSSSLPDTWGGMTQFGVGLNFSLRGVVSNESEFENNRYQAMANYVYVVASITRTQKLPWGMGLLVKVDGQSANQPLIVNEQYLAGGMESVRGYKENEQAGDNGMHGMIELSFPDPFEKSSAAKLIHMSPFLFYDFAALTIIDPLPTQAEKIRLAGTGAGVRGQVWKHLEYEVDWSLALKDTDITKRDDERVYFIVKAEF